MGRAFHQQRFDVTLYRASLFVCLIFFGGQHTLETDASPVPKVTSVNLASIPATTATTCTLGNSTTPNGHPDSKSSPSNGTTKAEEHDKHAGTTLKLDRMDRLRPAIWGGLDMTPSLVSAKAWGINELRNCPQHLTSNNVWYSHVVIQYTLEDPHSELDILDLDALGKDQATPRRMVPKSVPVPTKNLVTW